MKKNISKRKINMPNKETAASIKNENNFIGLFIEPSAIKTASRRCVYIKESHAELISKVVFINPKANMTIGGYINAVLEQHFNQYYDDILDYYESQKSAFGL
ncbi:DUF3408 domain-containing protein [Dysgonomonas macrotermitis]|nr:DUF3408 domain-containing protein [Dysgonomonas macrotermitis]